MSRLFFVRFVLFQRQRPILTSLCGVWMFWRVSRKLVRQYKMKLRSRLVFPQICVDDKYEDWG